jgi:DNA-binding PadR family transcriptional regulator
MMLVEKVSHKEKADVEWCTAHALFQPGTVEDTGLNFLFIVELVAKILYLRGQMRLAELSSHTKLSTGVLEQILAFMRTERLCQVARRGESETSVEYILTDLGRQRAEEYLRKNQYSGPAPVCLNAYIDQVRRQSISNMRVTRERLTEAFSG